MNTCNSTYNTNDLITTYRTRIKICGLTRESDVDNAVAAGADAIGFVLYAPSPRSVSPQRASELAARLPPFVTPVLLFVNEAIDAVITYSQQVPGSVLQFHGDETPEYCQQATQNHLRPYIKAARISNQKNAPRPDLVKYTKSYSKAQAVLLDTHVDQYGGSGQVFDWSLIPPNIDSHLVLSGGLTCANVIKGITQIRPLCRSLTIDVSSGVECQGVDGKPQKGLKDANKILRFVAAVKAADAQLANHHVFISTT